jgi:hypothetical protein
MWQKLGYSQQGVVEAWELHLLIQPLDRLQEPSIQLRFFPIFHRQYNPKLVHTSFLLERCNDFALIQIFFSAQPGLSIIRCCSALDSLV